MLVKVGRPILGMYLKIGQNRTRVGRYLKKVTKKWDILYERSLTLHWLSEIQNKNEKRKDITNILE